MKNDSGILIGVALNREIALVSNLEIALGSMDILAVLPICEHRISFYFHVCSEISKASRSFQCSAPSPSLSLIPGILILLL